MSNNKRLLVTPAAPKILIPTDVFPDTDARRSSEGVEARQPAVKVDGDDGDPIATIAAWLDSVEPDDSGS